MNETAKKEDPKDLTPQKPTLTPEQLIVEDDSEFALLLDSARFNQAWRVATLFAKSEMVPKHFQEKPESVFVVLHMALRLHVDPMMLMQNTYMVHGRPGMEAKLKIGLANRRGPFTGPIQYRMEGEGKERRCTAYATHAKTGELCEMTVDWKMVEAEGWDKDKQFRDGSGTQKSKWNTLPDLMFRYRSASFLISVYCPEVVLGLPSVDELEDMPQLIPAEVRTISRTAISGPQAASEEKWIDPALLAEFDRLVGEKKEAMLAHGQVRAFKTFLEETAKFNDISVDEMKAHAAEKFDGFWEAFEKWFLTQPKGTRTPKVEAPPAAPKGGAGGKPPLTTATAPEAQPGADKTPPVQIGEMTMANIRGILADKSLDLAFYFEERQIPEIDQVPLEELTEQDGQDILAWLKEQ